MHPRAQRARVVKVVFWFIFLGVCSLWKGD